MKNHRNTNSNQNYMNSTWHTHPEKIILLDNGAYEIKHSTAAFKTPIRKFQNCKFFEKLNYNDTAYFVENMKEDFPLENISTIGKNFCRPLSRGLLHDIDLELEIWEEIFSRHYNKEKGKNANYNDNMLIFTHTPMAPDDVIEGYFEMIFEYFGFNSCIKSIPQTFTAMYAKEKYENLNETVQLVVDSGFSSTTIVPIFENRPIYNAIKRIDIGGKLLTNYLKECLMNNIELDIRKEFFLTNFIKEETCYVSKNFNIDMKISSLKNSENNINKRTFVLPEYRKKSEEYLKKIPAEKHSIIMNSLRFIVPELIFNPNLIGVDEAGIHEAILKSVSECHPDFNNLLFKNIVINGGNAKFFNFKERLKNELTPISRIDNNTSGVDIYDMNLSLGEQVEPVMQGMKIFSRNVEMLKDLSITKKEYDEFGSNCVWKNCL
jgi:actin-related protein 6